MYIMSLWGSIVCVYVSGSSADRCLSYWSESELTGLKTDILDESTAEFEKKDIDL